MQVQLCNAYQESDLVGSVCCIPALKRCEVFPSLTGTCTPRSSAIRYRDATRRRIKHNAPMKEVAEASMLVLRANKARATDYVQLVQMAQPELYLTLEVDVMCPS